MVVVRWLAMTRWNHEVLGLIPAYEFQEQLEWKASPYRQGYIAMAHFVHHFIFLYMRPGVFKLNGKFSGRNRHGNLDLYITNNANLCATTKALRLFSPYLKCTPSETLTMLYYAHIVPY